MRILKNSVILKDEGEVSFEGKIQVNLARIKCSKRFWINISNSSTEQNTVQIKDLHIKVHSSLQNNSDAVFMFFSYTMSNYFACQDEENIPLFGKAKE